MGKEVHRCEILEGAQELRGGGKRTLLSTSFEKIFFLGDRVREGDWARFSKASRRTDVTGLIFDRHGQGKEGRTDLVKLDFQPEVIRFLNILYQ